MLDFLAGLERRLGCKGMLFVLVFFIGLVYILISYAIDNLAGCNAEMKRRFETTSLASNYESLYFEQLRQENPNINISNSYWSIEKYGGGCKIKFYVNTVSFRNTTYEADEFLINKDDNKIYPLSEGAKIFMNTFPNYDALLP